MRARELVGPRRALRRHVLEALIALALPIQTASAQARELVIQNRSSDSHVAFSPDGRLLATMSDASRTVRLWEVSTGHFVSELITRDGIFADVVFSPDGRHVAAVPMSLKHAMNGGGWIGTAAVWRVEDGMRLTGELPWTAAEVTAWASVTTDSAARRVATQTDSVRVISADGRIGVALDGERPQRVVTVRSLQTGVVTGRLPGTFSDVWLMALSPDGHFLALRCGPRVAEVWDLTRQERVRTPAMTGIPNAMAFASDGQHLATADERMIRLYDTRDWRATDSIAVDDELIAGIGEIVFSRDSKRMAIAGQDVRVIDLETRTVLPKPASKVTPIDAWSLGGSVLTVARSRGPKWRYADTTATVELWRFDAGAPRTIGSGLYQVASIATSSDGQRIVAGMMAETIWSRYTEAYEGGDWIWDGSRGITRISNGPGDRRPISDVVLAPDGASAIAVTHDPIPSTRGCAYIECGEDESTNYTVYVTRIDLRTGRQTDIVRLGRSDGLAGDVALSPRGDRVVARRDSVFRVTDANTGKRLSRFSVAGALGESDTFHACSGIDGPVMRFSPNGSTLLLTHAAGVAIVGATSGRVVRRFPVDTGESPRVLVSGHFASDSAIALLTCADSTSTTLLERLDIRTGQVQTIARLSGFPDDVLILPDGRFFTREGGVIRLYASTGELRASLLFGTDGEWMVVTPEGLYDASPRGTELALWRTGTTLTRVSEIVDGRHVPGLLRELMSR